MLSRFRVVNGLEEQVQAAFVARPHLVEDAPGFLGLETFVDASDEAVFYLLTRWSDFESFRTWHDSAAHRDSHRFIPRGLKLDPSFTQVLKLRKVSD